MENATEPDAPDARMLTWARNSAAYRLARAMMTERQLRDQISRKARQKFQEISEAQVAALADAAVRFAHDNKALDDRAYAEISTRSGVRNGKSRRAIAQRLVVKGVEREMALDAVAEADDLHAALVYARRRGAGPFRRVEADSARMAKEFASFICVGFGYDVVRRVCAMAVWEAEAILAGNPVNGVGPSSSHK